MASKVSVVTDSIVCLAREASEGKELAEVVQAAEKIRDRVKFVILLDTICYVYRTRRIPKVAAQMGSMLNVKPILTSVSGAVKFAAVVRSRERGIGRLLRIMRDKGRGRIRCMSL